MRESSSTSLRQLLDFTCVRRAIGIEHANFTPLLLNLKRVQDIRGPAYLRIVPKRLKSRLLGKLLCFARLPADDGCATGGATLPLCRIWFLNPRRLQAQPRVPPGFSRWQSHLSLLDLATRSQRALVQRELKRLKLPLQRRASPRVRLLI